MPDLKLPWLGFMVPPHGTTGYDWARAQELPPMTAAQATALVRTVSATRGLNATGAFIFGPEGDVLKSELD